MRLHQAPALASLIALLVMAGCGPDSPQSAPAGEADEYCAELSTDHPSFPTGDLLANLPVTELDGDSYLASQYRLARTADTCEPREPVAEASACALAIGDDEVLSTRILGRNEDDLAHQMFATGATRIISVDVTGSTHAGEGAFWLRFLETRFEDRGGAAAAAPLTIARGCTGDADQAGPVVLYDGDEPYLMAFQDRDRVLLVEARIVEFEGVRWQYPETASGLLPKAALESALTWFGGWSARQ